MSAFYIARMECGCIVASVVDDGKHLDELGRTLAEYVRSGLTLERITDWNAHKDAFGKCSHGNLQKRREANELIRKTPLHERLADIAVAWYGKDFDGDRASVVKDMKEAIRMCYRGADAYQICKALEERSWFDIDDELCRAIDEHLTDHEA